MPGKTEILHRYWFCFEKSESSNEDRFLPQNCGVTAYDYDDAMALMQLFVFPDRPIPDIAAFKKDLDMSILLEHDKHIRCCAVWRGFWWPGPFLYGPYLGSAVSLVGQSCVPFLNGESQLTPRANKLFQDEIWLTVLRWFQRATR